METRITRGKDLASMGLDDTEDLQIYALTYLKNHLSDVFYGQEHEDKELPTVTITTQSFYWVKFVTASGISMGTDWLKNIETSALQVYCDENDWVMENIDHHKNAIIVTVSRK